MIVKRNRNLQKCTVHVVSRLQSTQILRSFSSPVTSTVHIELPCYPIIFPHNSLHNRCIYPIVCRPLLFPADKCQCPALSAIVSQPYPHRHSLQTCIHQYFASAKVKDDNRSATNTAGCLVTKLYTMKTYFVTDAHINLSKPTGHVMHHQFNIQQLYALPTLYLRVLYLSENKQRLLPFTA